MPDEPFETTLTQKNILDALDRLGAPTGPALSLLVSEEFRRLSRENTALRRQRDWLMARLSLVEAALRGVEHPTFSTVSYTYYCADCKHAEGLPHAPECSVGRALEPLDEKLHAITMEHLSKLAEYSPGPVKKAGGTKQLLLARYQGDPLYSIFGHFGFELERIDRMRRRQSKTGLYEAVVFMKRALT